MTAVKALIVVAKRNSGLTPFSLWKYGLLVVIALTVSPNANAMDVATEIVTLGEDEDIRGLDFSPDGKFLATTSTQTLHVHIWDWRNQRIVRTFERPQGSDLLTTEPIRFSPDGRLLASCSSRSGPNYSVTRIWNTATGEFVHDIEEPNNGSCQAIVFSPDGKHLIRAMSRPARALESSLIVHDTTTWEAVWSLRTSPFYPDHLEISPDGALVALVGTVIVPAVRIEGQFRITPAKPQIVIVDLIHREVVRTIPASAERLAWSPDGARLVAAAGLETQIFDARSGEIVSIEKGEGGHALARYTPDGKYLIERINLRVKIWDGQHRDLYQEIPAAPGVLAVSRDGHYFAMGGDKKVIVWKLAETPSSAR